MKKNKLLFLALGLMAFSLFYVSDSNSSGFKNISPAKNNQNEDSPGVCSTKRDYCCRMHQNYNKQKCSDELNQPPKTIAPGITMNPSPQPAVSPSPNMNIATGGTPF
jgi:hypothetical protein